MPRDNRCIYMALVCFYVCCSDCVGVCGNVCCVAAVVKNSLQTTQTTSGGAVTANSSCCANCVEPPRPQQWGPDLPDRSAQNDI